MWGEGDFLGIDFEKWKHVAIFAGNGEDFAGHTLVKPLGRPEMGLSAAEP